MRVIGYVQVLTAGKIEGWADVPNVEVVINGEVKGVATICGQRDDCIEAGFPNARGVFFQPTRYLAPGENRIVLRDAVTSQLLENGDNTIHYDPRQAPDDHRPDDMKVIGYVQVLTADKIEGWADVPNVEVVINGEVKGVATVCGQRDDCIEAGFPNARGLFFRPMRYLAPGENRIVLRDAVSSQLLENGDNTIHYDPRQAPDDHRPDDMKVIGYVQLLTADKIEGWADVPNVEVVINGEVKGVATICGQRDDCIEAGFPNARGLFFRPMRYLAPGENRIVLRDAVSSQLLENGDHTIHYDPHQTVDDHWSGQYKRPDNILARWWQSEQIIRHVNKKVCGEPIADLMAGIFERVRRDHPSDLPFAKAVSVGAGNGSTEIRMVREGMVRSFDLFELSSYGVAAGRQQADTAGLGSAVTFIHGDAFALSTEPEKYDLVLWNQSLHHMPDVDAALSWSRKVLRTGGLLLLHEYVGPTRFQHPQSVLDANTDFRRSLPEKYLVNPWAPEHVLPTRVDNIDIDDLIAYDPSEGVDSGRILSCLSKYFPGARVCLTGGSIYLIALSDVLHNLLADGAEGLIAGALALDDELLAQGYSPYAVAIARK